MENSGCGIASWNWPNSHQAAISLTYDDGSHNHLSKAIPDLESHSLLGTFYLTTGSRRLKGRYKEWRAVSENGHEIGSHSVRHPCRADRFFPKIPRWLPPERWLENYSSADIERELEKAANWLERYIGEDQQRTYAYPCCDISIGKEKDVASYDFAVKKYYIAARIGGNAVNDPQNVDLYKINSFEIKNPSFSNLQASCEEARRTGGWTVLTFHGIGGPNLKTKRHVHRKLLKYLVTENFWVAPLRNVARYILEKRATNSTNITES